MKSDSRHEAVKLLREARGLLAEEEARPKSTANLKAKLERAIEALEAPPSRAETGQAGFAPSRLTAGEMLGRYTDALVNLVAALGLLVVVLALAFGKAEAPVEAKLCCELKCVSAQPVSNNKTGARNE